LQWIIQVQCLGMVAAIIVAAGGSARMGFDKLSADLGGQPVLVRSIRAFAGIPEVREIIVVTGEERRAALTLGLASHVSTPVRFATGGAHRHLSVLAGLAAVSAEATHVAVHDAARPLVSAADVGRVIAKAREVGAASLAHPIVETVKRADDSGRVMASVDRAGLWAMETPQVFEIRLLRRAYSAAMGTGATPTDEVSVVEGLGAPVFLLASSSLNLKITHPADLALASRCLTHQCE
jgi:2-C-methyl-D-erythritol 4-phosphate cytidylyltransferase